MREFYRLDTSRTGPDGECPVSVWVAGQFREENKLEVVAQDFGWFSGRLSAGLRPSMP
jgi:hypothetical protein